VEFLVQHENVILSSKISNQMLQALLPPPKLSAVILVMRVG
jgi:hypothetical protein